MDTLEYLKERVQELEVTIDNMRLMSVPQRIVCELRKLAAAHRLDPRCFHLPHTKGVLAFRVGIEAETFSRALPRLNDYGVHFEGRQVVVDDVKKVNHKVCDQCAGRDTCRAYRFAASGKPIPSS